MTALSGPKSPHCRDITITPRQNACGRNPLEECSFRLRDLSLTTHNTHETDIHEAGGIRTRNSSRRATADLRLRPRSHLNRPATYHTLNLIIHNSLHIRQFYPSERVVK
jgi:hypothetical protein